MLKEVKILTLICDSCNKDINEDIEYYAWNEIGDLEYIAHEEDWEKVDDKHYCPKCYEYDDNNKLILTKK
jgi:hypothetical protein